MVSKSFNKHGDHAYSVFGHTRQFGQGVKINHYFPGRNYYYQEPQVTGKPVEKVDKPVKPKPVQEAESENKDSENKMILIESGDKMMLLQPMEVVTQKPAQEETPVVKIEAVEGAPVKIGPGVVSTETVNTGTLDSTEVVAANSESTVDKMETNEEQKAEKKEDTVSDSDVASSYYHHSRIYYVGF